MQTIIKAHDAADFLALVPVLAGFQPRQSLALVPFRRGQSLGVMRLDLPPDDEIERSAATIVGMVCKVEAADSFAAVVYTDDPLRSGDGELAQALLIDALHARADLCGLEVTDALCVAADAWGSYFEPQAPARSLDEIDRRRDDPGIPAHAIDQDQGAGAELPAVDLAAKERVGRALAALEAALGALVGARGATHPARSRTLPGEDGAEHAPVDPLSGIDPRALAAACALDDLPELFEDALDWPEAPEPFACATLLWSLARPALRDVALVQWCEDIGTGDDALDAQQRWEDGEEYPAHIAERFWGAGPRPNTARLIRALSLVRHLAAVAPRESRPGPLAAAGWISWALGRSTHAMEYAARAIEIDADHGLSQIVMTMVSAGHLPEWAWSK